MSLASNMCTLVCSSNLCLQWSLNRSAFVCASQDIRASAHGSCSSAACWIFWIIQLEIYGLVGRESECEKHWTWLNHLFHLRVFCLNCCSLRHNTWYQVTKIVADCKHHYKLRSSDDHWLPCQLVIHRDQRMVRPQGKHNASQCHAMSSCWCWYYVQVNASQTHSKNPSQNLSITLPTNPKNGLC